VKLIQAIGVAAVVLVVGCYSLQPAGGVTPQPGTAVGFDITDVGRVALGGSMGPEISQIEGRLLDRDSTGYVIAVSAIHLLNGGDQTWSGEQVRLKPEYVASVYERRFSAGRSLVAGAAGLGVVAIIAARSLLGSSTPEDGRTPGDTLQATRGRRP
jgi:hypothetical protein